MTAPKASALLALVARMEDHMAFTNALREKLPKFKRTSAEWDATVAKLRKRKRGDRSKLTGAALVEEVALYLAKWRRRQLRKDDVPWDEAWERAQREVAAALDLSPSTLQDWYKGKSRRQRKKRERNA